MICIQSTSTESQSTSNSQKNTNYRQSQNHQGNGQDIKAQMTNSTVPMIAPTAIPAHLYNQQKSNQQLIPQRIRSAPPTTPMQTDDNTIKLTKSQPEPKTLKNSATNNNTSVNELSNTSLPPQHQQAHHSSISQQPSNPVLSQTSLPTSEINSTNNLNNSSNLIKGSSQNHHPLFAAPPMNVSMSSTKKQSGQHPLPASNMYHPNQNTHPQYQQISMVNNNYAGPRPPLLAMPHTDNYGNPLHPGQIPPNYPYNHHHQLQQSTQQHPLPPQSLHQQQRRQQTPSQLQDPQQYPLQPYRQGSNRNTKNQPTFDPAYGIEFYFLNSTNL